MKIPIFAHSSNPAVDRPLIHAGRERLAMLLSTGAVIMLTRRTAQYVRDRKDYIAPPVKPIPWTAAQLAERGYDKAAAPKHFSPAQITCAESRRNGRGCADQGKRRLTGAELMAMTKVANYGPASWADCVTHRTRSEVADMPGLQPINTRVVVRKAMAAS